MKLLPFAVAAALIAGPLHAAPSTAEKKMAAIVAAEQERNVALLEKLVNVNSGTLNLPGVTEVGAMVKPELDALGFETRWVPMAEAKRAGHLIAVHKGNGRGKRLLLIGHLDTVFEKDSPFQTFTRKGDKGEGPGASDDKGGVVVMLAALRAMKAAGTLKNADIEVVLTGDEEDVGDPIPLARRDLIEAGKRADAALDFEGLSVVDGKDMGSIARRSSTSWTLTVTARGGHSSGIFSTSAGNGAVYEMARIIDTFRRELPEPNLTFNVGLVLGGAQAALDGQGIRGTAAGKSNIIAEQAIARGDMRTLSNAQTERVRARMQAIVDQPLAGAKATIRFEEGYPAMAPTDGNRALLATLNGVNRDLGLPEQAPLDPLKRGAGDIAFVAADVAGLVGLGPSSEGDHAPGETVDLGSFERQATRAAVLMSRLAATPR
ncbi:M20/M25/M40 family metallo-hydrolase [Sphingomonas flavalba]|uniref:M20/M25/M40 family metallo-hydrolase n=1 Tax=Sphingomonas flavalba TaxID=2559804 RepID=UPI00109DAEC8|nr:M20/M25/M40 family metallo-hydrolase [Sphingomonas flavalba]